MWGGREELGGEEHTYTPLIFVFVLVSEFPSFRLKSHQNSQFPATSRGSAPFMSRVLHAAVVVVVVIENLLKNTIYKMANG